MKPEKQARHYTVEDYHSWPDDIRCELIDGVIYDMSPAPVIEHQRLSHTLAVELSVLLRAEKRSGDGGGRGGCELFTAPIDVVLATDSVVQPDLIVVCDPQKLANGKYVDGAPELVVEILSPATAVKDKREKRRLYERSGVKEYVLIDPNEYYAECYRLNRQGEYGLPEILGSRDAMKLELFPELDAPLGSMFGWPDNDRDIAERG
jgi:Uma2 family endonuclease